MLGQILERVPAILSRISAHKRAPVTQTQQYSREWYLTSVFLHRGEVDSLEGEVALSGVHESVVESKVQSFLRAAQDGTQGTCDSSQITC